MNRDPALAPETALLLRCARGAPDVTAISELAGQKIDWSTFLQLAETHGLSSLCCRRLEQADSVPVDARERLRGSLRIDAERNLFLTGELFRVLDQFRERGVDALTFKGPVLGWWLYGHPGLRRCSDVDVLVDAGAVDRAIGALTEIGYTAEMCRQGKPKIVPSTGQISLFRNAPPAEVDLHWDLAPRAMGLSLNARSLLPRSMAVIVGGRPVLTFGVEDQFLLCAFHGGKHGWKSLGWLADFAALIETRAPDWPRLLAEARRKQLSRALFVGLHLAHDLLGTPLPAAIRNPMKRDSAAASVAAETRAFLVRGTAPRALFPRELRYELGLTEGWGRKAAFCWRKITEPSPEDSEMSKSARPFRLMRKYAYRLAGLQ
ncbi:MAG TPA: nucleotidyltransferase family protein [Bryobacteraceae bacterium]|nr:nucleotidyltransferase family protein [Bryobacteraceae bacterium]